MKGALKLALIGTGDIAREHLSVLRTFDDAALVGVANRGEERRRLVAEEFDIPEAFGDYREMLAATEPDAVWVTVSLDNMYQVALHCLQKRIPCFVEKPPGVTAAETASLAEVASDTTNMVGVNRRFYSNLLHARALLQDHGGLTSVVIEAPQRLSDVGYWPGFESRTNIWNGIHCIDLLRFFGGDVRGGHSVAQRRRLEFNDTFSAMVTFQGGATGHFISQWLSPGKWSVTLYANDLRIEVCPLEGGVAKLADGSEHRLEVAEVDRQFKPGFASQNRYFVDCLLQGKAVTHPASDLADARKTMELAEAMTRGGPF